MVAGQLEHSAVRRKVGGTFCQYTATTRIPSIVFLGPNFALPKGRSIQMERHSWNMIGRIPDLVQSNGIIDKRYLPLGHSFIANTHQRIILLGIL
jgi:hypothetical protein